MSLFCRRCSVLRSHGRPLRLSPRCSDAGFLVKEKPRFRIWGDNWGDCGWLPIACLQLWVWRGYKPSRIHQHHIGDDLHKSSVLGDQVQGHACLLGYRGLIFRLTSRCYARTCLEEGRRSADFKFQRVASYFARAAEE